jgi:RimJ/RimL family protein N-acetyltransferase
MRVLATERLVLRWFQEQDAAAVFELMNSPEWIEQIGDQRLGSVDAARDWIANSLSVPYWRNGHGFWAVERREDGAFLGTCGLGLLDLPSGTDADVGFALLPRHCGKGYGREAAAACLRYGRDVLGFDRIVSTTLPSNAATIRVAMALGMTYEGTTKVAGDDDEVAVYAWGRAAGVPRAFPDDEAEIDALAGRFYASFSTEDAEEKISPAPSLFVPHARVVAVGPRLRLGFQNRSVRELLEPRLELLRGGSLTHFEEREIEHATTIRGRMAQRTSRRATCGVRDGGRFEETADATFQLARTAHGWKIAGVVWEEA